MLSKYRQKRAEGFTIIEVLIVLAIAGLILLVVFLAVPALQRNSRNTQRDNDVAGILGGMSEYVNNNNGSLPTQFGGSGTTLTIGASTSNQVSVNLGFYDAGDVDLVAQGSQTAPESLGDNTVEIVTGASCNGNAVALGQSRGFAAWYGKEVDVEICKQS